MDIVWPRWQVEAQILAPACDNGTQRSMCNNFAMLRRPLLVLALFLAGCGGDGGWNGSLEALLASRPTEFGKVMEDPERYRVQIIYTQIDRDADNQPSFRSYAYRLNPDEYFYPASTVKLPTAALALARLNELAIPGLDRNSVMLTGKAADFQTEATIDYASPTGLPSVGNYVRKVLVVSDNDAFNRLYEFLGQQYLNEILQKMGFDSTRIVHRLEVLLSPEEHAWTNPVRFMNAGAVVYQQPDRRSERNFLGRSPVPLGAAEIIDGERVNRPKNFSDKNAYPLEELHDTVKTLMFPESVPRERRFNLREEDYRFLWRYMSEYPSESQIEGYADGSFHPDGYVKFLMYGGSASEIPANIRIFNKVGDAYGFLTDAAYIVDFENGIEFLLAATVYTNENQVFNDDVYEYEDIGFPFLRDLGQAIYAIELKRERAHKPDLSHLQSLRAP